MRREQLETLRRYMDPAKFEAYVALIRKRSRRGECPACGGKTMRADYVCPACSQMKAATPRWFWHYVTDLTGGGEGRPRAKKSRPQSLPSLPLRPLSEWIAREDEVEPVKVVQPNDREWWVTIGNMTVVVRAVYGFEAVSDVLNEQKLPTETAASWMCAGTPVEDVK